ncbi:MAG: hypothetical protein SGCHY_003937, partial [Lobulomycetales sp.]
MSDAFATAYPLPPRYYKQLLLDPHTQPTPPLPPAAGEKYEMFGNVYAETDSIPRLAADLGQTQLYNDSVLQFNSHNVRLELKKLNHSLLVAFARLVLDLTIDPVARHEARIEQIRFVLVNVHHLLNSLRPVQARQTLELLMKMQVERKLDMARELN